MSRGRIAAAALVALLAALACAERAGASIWVADNARAPALRVDARGNAEVSWTDASGSRRFLLVPPSGRVFPGRRLSGADVSRPTSAVAIPLKVTLRRTPDGRLWALQSWRLRKGGPVELHLSRWRGAPTTLTLSAICCKYGKDVLQGKASFQGRPVYGFSPTPEGKKMRAYAYLECFACSAGSGGWTPMLGVATRAPGGAFSVLVRAKWDGTRYRARIMGPNRGTTLAPDAEAVAPGSGGTP
jgi:hypothetical protein